jgi:3-isopropylmalate/(R)-2-methylmalate dehydratase small subunit
MICEGKVWRYGDNVDTDVIIPARYLNDADPRHLARHCMEDIDPAFAQSVQTGDILVGGKNFGCGSSREHAPVALKACGISCVVAESFARIFYRNAVNIGLSVVEMGERASAIRAGERLRVDLAGGTVDNITSGQSDSIQPLPGFIREIAEAGGLIAYVKGARS